MKAKMPPLPRAARSLGIDASGSRSSLRGRSGSRSSPHRVSADDAVSSARRMSGPHATDWPGSRPKSRSGTARRRARRLRHSDRSRRYSGRRFSRGMQALVREGGRLPFLGLSVRDVPYAFCACSLLIDPPVIDSARTGLSESERLAAFRRRDRQGRHGTRSQPTFSTRPRATCTPSRNFSATRPPALRRSISTPHGLGRPLQWRR